MTRDLRRTKAIRRDFRRMPVVLLFLAAGGLVVADIAHEAGFIAYDIGLNGFDDAAILLIAFFALKGYLEGFVLTLFSLVGYVAGLIGAGLLSPALAALAMNRTGLGDALSRRLSETLPALADVPVKAPDTMEKLYDATRWLADTPAAARLLEENPLLSQVFGSANANIQTQALFSAPVSNLNDWLVWSLLRLLSVFVLFVAIKLAFTLLGRLVTMLMDLTTVLGTANRMAGMGMGLLAGVLFVYVLYGTVLPFLGSIGLLKLPETFTESVFLSWLNRLIALRGNMG